MSENPNDLYREQLQYGYRATNIPEAWRYVHANKSDYTPVYGHIGDPVSDTLDLDVAERRDFTDDPVPEDIQRDHGIKVVSQAAAQTGNNVGMAGVSDAEVYVAQFINGNYDRSHPVRVGTALRWLVDAGADVINISWSFGQAFYTELFHAVQYALRNGVLVVTSAGNSGTNKPDMTLPGAFALPNIVSVAATRANDDELTGFSNFGTFVDVAAPGFALPGYVYDDLYNPEGRFGDIPVTENPDDETPYRVIYTFGTSFSAPLTAGIAMLMLRVNPDLRNRPVVLKRLLMGTAQDMGLTGPLAGGAGAGRVDALAAVEAANDPIGYINRL
jgi:hypothetical protein